MQLTDFQKKILFSAGLVIFTIIFGFLIYTVFFKGPEEEYVNINGEQIPISIFPDVDVNVNEDLQLDNINAFEGVPSIDRVASGSNTLAENILSEQAEGVTLADNGEDLQYYDSEEGKFYKLTADGEKELLTDEIFKGVENINWSNDSNEAVLEFEDGYNIYYDFDKEKQYTLDKNMEDFTFSPNDDQIGFKYMAIDEEDRWLAVMNPDGSNSKGIERLGDNADSVQVAWSPSGKAVATYQEYVDGGRQKVIPLGLNGENYKQMLVEGRDFDYNWSPNGQQMLYSVFSDYSDFKPTLWVVDADGENIGNNRQPLEINTWVDKCTFSSTSSIYCAVPQSLPTGAGYSKEIADDIPDSIYQIDLKTGTKNLVAIPTNSYGTTQYTVESMEVSADGSTLFFTDMQDKNIHKVQLK